MPWGPGWPTRRGIREFVIIGQKCVADRECKDANIPLTHNVNFPDMYGPLGQGTPEDLELLNMAINEMLSDLVQHVRQMCFPAVVAADTLVKANPDVPIETFRSPGTVLTAPDNQVKDLEQFLKSLEPGQVSPDLWKFLSQLLDLIDKQGNMAGVLQGQAPSGTSGTLFGQQNAAAQTAILFVAKRAETMLKYLAGLMLGGIKRMSIEAMMEAVPDTPEYIWDAFKDWWQRGLFLDISVEISSGGGAAKQQRATSLINAAASAAKVPVSPQTQLEALELDPDKEAKRTREWQDQMQAMPQQPQAQAAPQEQPQPQA
jgi:hypothetical protein